MSKPVRYDPPLVRALAAELHARLAGRGAHAVPLFDRDRSATLLLDRGEALRWELHPQRGWPLLGPRPAGLEARPADARIIRVSAPADERLIYLDLAEGGRFRGAERRLVVELHTNQWNALLVERASRQILSVLRGRDAGGRVLRPGATYQPPPVRARRGGPADHPEALRLAWMAELAATLPEDRRGVLLRAWADVSPLNVDSILGTRPAGSDADLSVAFDRWWALHTGADASPVVLELEGGGQPYPVALPGVRSRPVASLLAAFAAAAAAAPEVAAGDDSARLLAEAERRLTRVRQRIESLRAEAAGAADHPRVRALGDLLLANLDRVPAGADRVVLPGFDGEEVEVPLDATLRPNQNADALYERARRMARAEARIPELIERAEREAERWGDAVAALRRGERPEWLEGALARRESREQGIVAPRLPYHPYRTSGGLEVRVGRGRADNDRLTFHHSAPDDVWLHARQVPGSHVVLRWTSPDAPPARDLEEAAALAAWHSKARGSATVAVDWTRRRYVRKPRGAPAGRVVVQRAKTVFVAPAERPVAE